MTHRSKFSFIAALTLAGLSFAPSHARVAAQATVVVSADAYAYESITVSATAVGFTSTLVSPANAPSAKLAILTIETAGVRYRYDGTAPTAAQGHAAAMDTSLTVNGINNINRFRIIKSGATDATVRVTYLR